MVALHNVVDRRLLVRGGGSGKSQGEAHVRPDQQVKRPAQRY